jgi:DNA replication protein DnaC
MEKLTVEAMEKSLNRTNLPTQRSISENSEMSIDEQREQLRKRLNISSLENTFANFKPVKGAGESLKLFKELSTRPEWYMLLCLGTPGCGKTHLCEGLSIELYKAGIFAPVVKFNEMISAFKKAINSDYVDAYNNRISAYKKMRCLILDDYGLGVKISDYDIAIVEEFIDYRYRERLMTVLTSNLDLDKLPGRVVSRFGDGETSRIVINRAIDYRPLKGSK